MNVRWDSGELERATLLGREMYLELREIRSCSLELCGAVHIELREIRSSSLE